MLLPFSFLLLLFSSFFSNFIADVCRFFERCDWRAAFPDAEQKWDRFSLDQMRDEEVFQTFCYEYAGIRRVVLHELFAAFSGGDVHVWFRDRAESSNADAAETRFLAWMKNGFGLFFWFSCLIVSSDGLRLVLERSVTRSHTRE